MFSLAGMTAYLPVRVSKHVYRLRGTKRCATTTDAPHRGTKRAACAENEHDGATTSTDAATGGGMEGGGGAARAAAGAEPAAKTKKARKPRSAQGKAKKAGRNAKRFG